MVVLVLVLTMMRQFVMCKGDSSFSWPPPPPPPYSPSQANMLTISGSRWTSVDGTYFSRYPPVNGYEAYEKSDGKCLHVESKDNWMVAMNCSSDSGWINAPRGSTTSPCDVLSSAWVMIDGNLGPESPSLVGRLHRHRIAQSANGIPTG